MPANLGQSSDPRFQRMAYIGRKRSPTRTPELYYVLGYEQRVAPLRGAPFVTLSCERCRTNETVQLDPARVREDCVLVRAAPFVAG